MVKKKQEKTSTIDFDGLSRSFTLINDTNLAQKGYNEDYSLAPFLLCQGEIVITTDANAFSQLPFDESEQVEQLKYDTG